MAYSIQQAMEDYFNNSGGGGVGYGGTGLSSGPIAGGSGKAPGAGGGAKAPAPSAPKAPSKLPFDPGDYSHQEHVQPPHNLMPYTTYYNGTYVEDGQTQPCDGWAVFQNGHTYKLPDCSTKKPPLFSYNDWHL